MSVHKPNTSPSKHNLFTPIETACSFGNKENLVGVYTPSQRSQNETKAPCAIYISAGFLHHIGPSRLHVEMARSLAQEGVCGFRFDLSGIGESESTGAGGYFTERSVKEIIQAMDMLQTEMGHQQFVLIGLCSGADDALATALVDSRVSGLVLLNGYSYQAGLFKLNRWLKFYLPRLCKPEKLQNLFKKQIQRVKSRFVPRSAETTNTLNDEQALAKLDEDYRYVPPQEETEDQLLNLCQAELDLLCIYTGSEHEDYTYEQQFFAMFPKLKDNNHVSVRYFANADHTFTLKEDRHQLIGWVRLWYNSSDFKRNTK